MFPFHKIGGDALTCEVVMLLHAFVFRWTLLKSFFITLRKGVVPHRLE